MSIRTPFRPSYGTNQIANAGASSLSITLNAVDKSVRVVNTGSTNKGYFRIGNGVLTATSADCVILAGQSIVVEKGDGQDKLAYISASGTTLEIMTGEGGYD